MEDLTASPDSALTAYDMLNGIDREVAIEEVVLLQKSGGKEDWSREP
jgi:molybdenum cofactor biosynthesis enzyme